MSPVVVDDHLLRDILTSQTVPELEAVLTTTEVYTTNLWFLRLCRSVATSTGGRLTGALAPRQRQALGRELIRLPADVRILPFTDVAWQMAERHSKHPLSTLSCEALAVAERLDAEICVWSGDVGPKLQTACQELGVSYRLIG